MNLQLPADEFAEASCLGSCFASPEAAALILGDVNDEDFYFIRNKTIYSILKGVYKLNPSFSIDEVYYYHKNNTQHGNVGIKDIANVIAFQTTNYQGFVERVKKMSSARRAIFLYEEAMKKLSDSPLEVDDIISANQNQLMALDYKTGSDAKTLNQVANNIRDGRTFEVNIDWLTERAIRGDKTIQGIPTYYPRIDNATDGLLGGKLTYVGARTHVGKTTFMLNLCSNMIKTNLPFAVFSLEMELEDLFQKMACLHVGINYPRYRRGQLTDNERLMLKRSAQELRNSKMIFQSFRDATIANISMHAKKLKITDGIKVLFVDYLTLIKSPNKHNTVHHEVSEVSSGLLKIAKTLDISVVSLAQLRRSPLNNNPRPTLADFRESGSIEQDADVVIFLHRPEDEENVLLVDVAKNRNLGELPDLIYRKANDSEKLYEEGFYTEKKLDKKSNIF